MADLSASDRKFYISLINGFDKPKALQACLDVQLDVDHDSTLEDLVRFSRSVWAQLRTKPALS